MFATVELRAELKPAALLVPDSAVLRSGEKNTVFVALDGGHFEPRDGHARCRVRTTMPTKCSAD